MSMMKRLFTCMIAVVAMVGCLSACVKHTASDSDNMHFIEHSYCFDDPNAMLDLVFYYTGEPFVDKMDEISRCAIGMNVSEMVTCELERFELKTEPLYEVAGIEYNQGFLSVKLNGLNSTIKDAQLMLTLNDGTTGAYPIGDIFFSPVEGAVNDEAMQFIEYALVNPAIYADGDGNPKTAAIALEVQILSSITINSVSCMLEEIGLDMQNSTLYSYDDFASNISGPLDNMKLDNVIDGIYDRKVMAKQNTDCSFELAPGRFVLLIPLTQCTEEVLEPLSLGLDIAFRVDGVQYSMHVYCNPLFTENFHSLSEVSALFAD